MNPIDGKAKKQINPINGKNNKMSLLSIEWRRLAD